VTQLDRFLKDIDPARTLDVIAERADHALNPFHVPSALIERWGKFCALLTSFYLHVQKAILRLPPHYEGNAEFEWAGCREILNKAYGHSGYKAAFEMARTGNEGGLYQVLKTIAHGLADQYAKQEIAARTWSYINSMTVDEQFSSAREYLAKYGHLLPSELTEGSAARIIDNFAEVLQEYTRLAEKLRNIGR
jgi:hypothetical protein